MKKKLYALFLISIIFNFNNSFAYVSSKCLDQINLALNQGSDSAPIPVECQYYKVSDLDKTMQDKVFAKLKKQKDAVTKDSKLSGVLGALRNSNNPEVATTETKEIKPTPLQAESLILTNSTSEGNKEESNSTSNCVPDSTIDLANAARISIEKECDVDSHPDQNHPGKVYFADDIDFSRAIVLNQDERWCAVDDKNFGMNRELIKSEWDDKEAKDGSVIKGCSTTKEDSSPDFKVFMRHCLQGNFSLKCAVKKSNSPILKRLKYFVPAKNWKNIKPPLGTIDK